jgi:siderophore synthetase component
MKRTLISSDIAASPIHPKWFSVRLLSMRLPMIWQIMYTGIAMHGAHSQLTGM